MVKFIELHIYRNGASVLVNVDSISYVTQVRGLAHIYLNAPDISSSEMSGALRSISSSLVRIVVKESYSRVKATITD